MKNVLVVDCHDSFVYNLVQLLRESSACKYEVVSIDAIDFAALNRYSHVLLSPGPGLPADFPNFHKIIHATASTHVILGVCLGMQAIAEYFGCHLQQLKHPQHGHTSTLNRLDAHNPLLYNLSPHCTIGHYHSWVVNGESIARPLIITAKDDAEHVMAIRHQSLPIFGVQFHPESIITHEGSKIIKNWLENKNTF